MKVFVACVLAVCAFHVAHANIIKDLQRQAEIAVDDLQKYEKAFPAELKQILESIRKNNEYHFTQKLTYVLNNLKNANVKACYSEAESQLNTLKEKVVKNLKNYLDADSIKNKISAFVREINDVIVVGKALIEDFQVAGTEMSSQHGAMVGLATKALTKLRSDINGLKNSKVPSDIQKELRETMKNEVSKAISTVDEIYATARKCIKA